MIEIVTMRYGTKYGPEYLQKWAAGVKRNITVPHRMVCFTDEPAIYDPDVVMVLTEDLGGWWNHLWAFCGWTENRQMMIDLDDVIVGSLDDLASYDGPHAINSDVYAPQNVDGGCQLIPKAANFDLYWQFIKNRAGMKARYYSDKPYYVDRINEAPRLDALFPGQHQSFKVHCQYGLPGNARIISFHGVPKPAQVNEPWVKEHWRVGDAVRR